MTEATRGMAVPKIRILAGAWLLLVAGTTDSAGPAIDVPSEPVLAIADARRLGQVLRGLPVARCLVEAMGGDLVVESEVGKGSGFVVGVRAGRRHEAWQ